MKLLGKFLLSFSLAYRAGFYHIIIMTKPSAAHFSPAPFARRLVFRGFAARAAAHEILLAGYMVMYITSTSKLKCACTMLRTMSTFVSAQTFCASHKLHATCALGLELTKSTTLPSAGLN